MKVEVKYRREPYLQNPEGAGECVRCCCPFLSHERARDGEREGDDDRVCPCSE